MLLIDSDPSESEFYILYIEYAWWLLYSSGWRKPVSRMAQRHRSWQHKNRLEHNLDRDCGPPQQTWPKVQNVQTCPWNSAANNSRVQDTGRKVAWIIKQSSSDEKVPGLIQLTCPRAWHNLMLGTQRMSVRIDNAPVTMCSSMQNPVV